MVSVWPWTDPSSCPHECHYSLTVSVHNILTMTPWPFRVSLLYCSNSNQTGSYTCNITYWDQSPLVWDLLLSSPIYANLFFYSLLYSTKAISLPWWKVIAPSPWIDMTFNEKKKKLILFQCWVKHCFLRNFHYSCAFLEFLVHTYCSVYIVNAKI